ncbi:glycoside hydrolase family 31 protein [Candidatus Epulonipiscium viviparus]|uniref:glycoside hydrolase family 31 protein n=1 Tax=Candidatus Epulonipiscium viviparus TaxID=420336 RepID=UPI00273810B7|nr:glycoside hydrolase family 31 protein [Candidatus Epulopiscium viviparus]
MLKVIPKVSYAIESFVKTNTAVTFTAARGKLRLKPQNDKIIRVTYTEREDFVAEVGAGIEKDLDYTSWSLAEEPKHYVLQTSLLTVHIIKETGQLKYFSKKGNLLLQESEIESHQLMQFESMRVVVDKNLQIEEEETPDGMKQVIKSSAKEFDKNLYRTRLGLQFQTREKLYGLGQAEEGTLNLRGTTQYLHQANLKIAIPMLVSTAGYGLLSATASPAIFSDTAYGSYFYTEADIEMDFYFIAGAKIDDVIHGYRLLTGKAAMLPRWAFGFVQSQEAYETQAEILDVAKGYRDRKIGIDCLVMDWRSWEGDGWGQKTVDKNRFPDLRLMTNTLREQNIHFMLSMWPNMHATTENYKEFAAAGLLLPAHNIYNALDADARKLYFKQTNDGLFSQGVDSFWCDCSEPFCPEWTSGSFKREPSYNFYRFFEVASKYLPAELTNSYSLFHAQAIYEGQREVDDSKRVLNLTRSSYTGGQKYGVVVWSGDTCASWETFAKQIVAGLNLCASGLPYWTLDIGAFFVKYGEKWFWKGKYNKGLEDLGYRELFVRWFQYGVFMPMFRSHGTDIRREMWNFDAKEDHRFYDALVAANQLRYTLIPYIYSMAAAVYFDDYTIMRLLAFDFAEDVIACEVKDEFMFGDILVCPVTEPMYYESDSAEIFNVAKTREVYLPKGTAWYNFYSDEKFEGGKTITVDADLSKIPLFVREGAIIPRTEATQSTADAAKTKLLVHIYGGKSSTFNLYQDKGDGYGYETGDYGIAKLLWDGKTATVDGEADVAEFIVH